jgi:hypothetical protein
MNKDYKENDIIYYFGKSKSYYEESVDKCFLSPENYLELDQYYRRNLGPTWYTLNKKSALKLLSIEDYLFGGVIIQVGGKFNVFLNNPDLEQFSGLSLVNEIIPKQRLRYPTIDIDSKVPSLNDLLNYFGNLVESVDDIIVFTTTGGYHMLLKNIPIDFEEHVALIESVDKDNPTWNVDKKAGLHSIKVVGTKSMKPGSVCKRLIHPSGVNNNDTLSCPVNIQPRYERINDDNSDKVFELESEDIIGNASISEDEIENIFNGADWRT